MALLLHLTERDEASWAEALRAKLPGYPIYLPRRRVRPRRHPLRLRAGSPAADTFDDLPNLKAILSLGAGVDGLLRHPRLPDVPIVRFVDDELSQCMADYVVAQVSMHQRLFTQYKADQKARRWVQHYPGAATTITVGIMGLGVIGQRTIDELQAAGLWASRLEPDPEGDRGRDLLCRRRASSMRSSAGPTFSSRCCR